MLSTILRAIFLSDKKCCPSPFFALTGCMASKVVDFLEEVGCSGFGVRSSEFQGSGFVFVLRVLGSVFGVFILSIHTMPYNILPADGTDLGLVLAFYNYDPHTGYFGFQQLTSLRSLLTLRSLRGPSFFFVLLATDYYLLLYFKKNTIFNSAPLLITKKTG
jgi:hypothetical protein